MLTHAEQVFSCLPRNQMKHVVTFRRLSIFYARLARQLDAQIGKHGQSRHLVSHAHEPRVEVNLRG